MPVPDLKSFPDQPEANTPKGQEGIPKLDLSLFPDQPEKRGGGFLEAIGQRLKPVQSFQKGASVASLPVIGETAINALDIIATYPANVINAVREGKSLTKTIPILAQSIAERKLTFKPEDFEDDPGARDPAKRKMQDTLKPLREKIKQGTITSEETKQFQKKLTSAFGEAVPVTKEEKAEAANFAFVLGIDPLNFVGWGLGEKALKLLRFGKTAEATKVVEEIVQVASKSNIDDVVRTLGKTKEESVLKQILTDIKEGKSPEQILTKTAKENIDVSKLPDVTKGKIQELTERGVAIEEGLKAKLKKPPSERAKLTADEFDTLRSEEGGELLRESLQAKERLGRLEKQVEEAGGRRIILGPNEERITIKPNGDRIIRDRYGNLIEEIPARKPKKVVKAKEPKPKKEKAPKKAKVEEPTPIEALTAKVKAGKATGKEIKQFVKESEPATVEKTETALRQEFKAAKAGSKEQGDIAQGIDILTQEAGKKPKVPPKKTAPLETLTKPKEAPVIAAEEPKVAGIGISPDIKKRSVNFIRRFFKSGGAKPKIVVRAEEKLRGNIAAKMRNIDRQLNTLRQSTKNVSELKTEAGLKKMDAYLKGDKSVDLPRHVKVNLDAMRDTIDNLSRRLMRSGIPSEKLQLTIEENLGQYVTRSYRKFLEKGYKPSEAVRQQARALLTHTVPSEMVGELPNLNYVGRRIKLSNAGFETIEDIARADANDLVSAINTKGYTAEKALDDIKEAQRLSGITRGPLGLVDTGTGEISARVEGRIEELLAKDLDKANFQRGTVMGRVNLNNLKRRKEIDLAIRDLYGEIKDPYVNFHQTAQKIISQVENRKFLEQMAEFNNSLANGSPKKFLYKKAFKQGDNAYSVRISAEGNKALEPIDGMFTTQEIADELKDFDKMANLAWGWKKLIQSNTVAKYTKTITSPITVVRNFYGNIGFATANGHWRIHFMPEAMNITRRNLAEKIFGADALRGNFKLLAERFAKEGIVNRKQLHEKALKLGVIEDNVYSGELKDLLKDMGTAIDEGKLVTAKGADKYFRKSTQAATEIYSAMDDVWKLYGWFNEIARGKTLEQAARIVRDTYPTYSKVPRFGKMMRRFPVLGTFISFPTEVMRVGKNIAKLAFIEKDIPRLIGMGTATAGTFGAYLVSNYSEGVTNEEQAALREFVAPWEKNGQLFVTNIDDENISFINSSYTDPWSYISDPTRALYQGFAKGDIDGAFKNALTQFFEPYLSEGLFVERVVDWARNKKTGSGAPVYNEEDSYEDKFYKSVQHIGETLVPPLTPILGTQYQRLERGFKKELTETGRRDLLTQEGMNLVIGVRKRTINKKEALKYSGLKIGRRLEEANRIINEGLRETSSMKDFKEKYQATEDARKKIFEDFQYKVKAARTLGLNDEEIKSILADRAGMSRSTVDEWVSGNYTPYQPGSVKMQRIQEKFGIKTLGRRRRRPTRRRRSRTGQTPLEQLIQGVEE